MTLQTQVLDLFEELEPEEEQEIREFKVNNNTPNLAGILRGFVHVLATGYHEVDHVWYSMSEQAIPKTYTTADIERFSHALPVYEKWQFFTDATGIYIMALINNSDEERFVVHTNGLTKLLECFGYNNNGKHITVNGNLGDDVADHMEDGVICVNGDVGNGIGGMMKKGKLIVNGYAGKGVGVGVGCGLWGGEIHLNGDYDHISGSLVKGKVYHKGVLIADIDRLKNDSTSKSK